MAELINLPTYKDRRGCLTIIEKCLPFEIKRIYYIYNASSKRGGHRHKKTIQALVCLSGSCEIFVDNNQTQEFYHLDSPDKCLLLETQDWHTMDNFSMGSVLLVLASEYYDINDYIDEKYL